MYATFLSRLKAFFIDYLLILMYLVLLILVSVFIIPDVQKLFQGSLLLAQGFGFLLVTLPVSLYFAIADSVVGGASLGKRKVGIQVVGREGTAVSVLHSLFRTALKFLPWELSHFLVYRMIEVGDGETPVMYFVLGGLIYAWIFANVIAVVFTKRKQSIYDLVVRTRVLKGCNQSISK
ncbi:RDD family protein [Pontibacillus yanchengensis]|uniref:RDD domain-containing protein n=1 Tax=Pontibacillus yanchengensis Y32 TaxID=1385514 RepID=A0A0A2T6Y8_9BACI|nr:RDD family protein [Pontibacillus yanchengensis]KGP71264.1 hypothetical protein N782_20280 [Pontibacillus yanchengensis Y32]